ncbi:glycosyltransferase [Chromohalobacter israelensis]|uniref:glycosyltransferase n=1 Tax=Chromohalobacter israelensis TaxID=141390 RepID=UPI000A5B27EF|nr:glycosyltransferase [Chromohalobacter israelensis]MDF9436053.1 glycosyltransferase [Chromohalobacter israelensis]
MSNLKKGNQAFVREEYETAKMFYQKALDGHPDLAGLIRFNIKMAERRGSRKATVSSGFQIKRPSIDIVIPVFNALDDVRQCVASIKKHRGEYGGKNIIVNDGSDEDTTKFLQAICGKDDDFELIEHKSNLGYTKTVNDGLKRSSSDFVITLNSDTVVTPGWLDGLIRCMNHDERIGVVGPLSNAASWQSVPKLKDGDGSFCINEVPDGFSFESFSSLVTQVAVPTYPRLPFINGFCFMIRRAVLDKVGLLDEELFPSGYGEENDFCIRVLDAGFDLAVADDVYVYHSKSKSFGHERRKVLSQKGSDNLRAKHGVPKYKDLVDKVKDSASLDLVRDRISNALAQKDILYGNDALGKMKIVFVLPVRGGGGGAHSVVQEAHAMRALGINAKVGVESANYNRFIESYPSLKEKDKLFLSIDSLEASGVLARCDVLVATVYKSVKFVKSICEKHPHILPAYYIQDYEPYFFDQGSNERLLAAQTYEEMHGAFCFAKTHWIANEVYKHHRVRVNKVAPSIDHDVYYPGFEAREKIVISAMIRPKTPYRGSERTMELFDYLNKEFGSKVELVVFGCDSSDEFFETYNSKLAFKSLGVLTREGVSTALRGSDIFVDLSDYQAFGRTALEAMACACVPVVTKHGGTDEYALDGVNSFVVDSFDLSESAEKASQLISSPSLLHRMRMAALETASNFSPHRAAVSEVAAFARALERHRLTNPKSEKKKLVVHPSRRGDGVPAGSGFVRTVLPYNHRNITKAYDVEIIDHLPDPSEFDRCILQRDVEPHDLNDIKLWVERVKSAGKEYIYEVDDDLLDSTGLVQRGYRKDPVVLAEKVKFLASGASLVTVSTGSLRDIFYPLNKNIQVVPNALDENLWKLEHQRNHVGVDFGRSKDVIKIGYIGTDSHAEDLKLIAPAMKALEEKYGSRIEIEIIGAFQNKEPLFGKRVPLPRATDYPSFVKWLLKRVHWDIGLIPLVDDRFNASKSNLKFLEYAALEMAIVVSDVSTYRNIANTKNSFMVENDSDAWFQAVELLLKDSNRRHLLSSAARGTVCESWSLAAQDYSFIC